jgi:hypothetical protein
LALALLLSQLRPAVYGRKMLRDISGLPVFGTVSRVWTPAARRRRNLELAGFLLAAVLLVPATAGVAYMQVTGRTFAEVLRVAGG